MWMSDDVTVLEEEIEADATDPIIRFDTHHGVHELHLGSEPFDINYPGLVETFRTWRGALPTSKRADW